MWRLGRTLASHRWHVLPLAIVLTVIWVPERLLTQDGPAHLYTAALLAQLRMHPDQESCYRVVAPPPPNFLTAGTGAVLVPWLGTAATEKIWATLYALLLAGGAVALARRIRPDGCSVAIYFFILNPFFFSGFWNFNLGIGLLFLSLSAALGFWEKPGTGRAVTLSLWGILLYFTHLFLFSIFLVSVLPLLTGNSHRFSAAAVTKTGGKCRPVAIPEQSGKETRRTDGAPFCRATLALLWIGAAAIGGTQMKLFRISPEQVGSLTGMAELRGLSLSDLSVWYRYGEQTVLPVLQLAVLGVVVWRAVRRELAWTWVALPGFLLLLFLITPDQLGVGMALKGRLWLLATLIAAICLPQRWTRAVGTFCALLLLWHVSQVLPRQVRWNRPVRELLLAGRDLQPGQIQASLMGIYWGRTAEPRRVIPWLHADLLLAAETAGWSLSSNQMASPEFPIQYRSECTAAAEKIADLFLREIPSAAAIAATVEGAAVRYVVIWKSGTLPWDQLRRRWQVVRETNEFLVLDVKQLRIKN